MWITFSRTIQRGFNARANRTTCNAVARLASLLGAEPFAQVWFVHSGEARRMSTLPNWRLASAPLICSRRSVSTLAPGKLAAYAAVARQHWSMPPTIETPAPRAPALLPPTPQNMSSPRIVARLIPQSSVRGTLPGLVVRNQASASFRQPAAKTVGRGVGCLESSGLLRPNELAQPSHELALGDGLALPDDKDTPTEFAELPEVDCIPTDVVGELPFPERGPGLWRIGEPTRVPMPKTPVYLNDLLAFGQNDVRSTRQGSDVQTESMSQPMKHSSHSEFGLGVFAPNASH